MFVGDAARALNRIQSNNAPDCVVFFGEAIEGDITKAFTVAAATSSRQPLGVIAVLSKDQNKLKTQFKKTASNRVLLSPITLRDLRKEIHLSLQHAHQDSSELKSVTS